jgi:hypothetical protein
MLSPLLTSRLLLAIWPKSVRFWCLYGPQLFGRQKKPRIKEDQRAHADVKLSFLLLNRFVIMSALRKTNKMVALAAILLSTQCMAFSFQTSRCVVHRDLATYIPRVGTSLSSVAEASDSHRSNVIEISSPQAYVKFLQEDDQLCVVK